MTGRATPDVVASYKLGRVEVWLEDHGQTDPCHVWTGATVWGGYALRRIDKVRYLEHRRAYEEKFGPIPDGWDLHHRCGVRRCINPDHLEPLSRTDHIRRHVGISVGEQIEAIMADGLARRYCELCRLVPDASKTSVKAYLARAREHGRVVRIARGLYVKGWTTS